MHPYHTQMHFIIFSAFKTNFSGEPEHPFNYGNKCRIVSIWAWFSVTKQTKSVMQVIKKMGQYLKMDISVPNEYIEGFTKADNTFLYQLVFDPLKRKVVPLNPYPDHIDPASLSYAGTYLLCRHKLKKTLHFHLIAFALQMLELFLNCCNCFCLCYKALFLT